MRFPKSGSPSVLLLSLHRRGDFGGAENAGFLSVEQGLFPLDALVAAALFHFPGLHVVVQLILEGSDDAV